MNTMDRVSNMSKGLCTLHHVADRAGHQISVFPFHDNFLAKHDSTETLSSAGVTGMWLILSNQGGAESMYSSFGSVCL